MDETTEQKLPRVVSGCRYQFTFLEYDKALKGMGQRIERGTVLATTPTVFLVNCGKYVIGIHRETIQGIHQI